MCGELTAVVGGDGSYPGPVREQQPDHGFRRRECLPPIPEPFHEDEIGGTFRQGKYGMAV